jgi:hypothetical protein
MTGSEHRMKSRRALRSAAPPLPFTGCRFVAAGLAAAALSTGPVARIGLSLARNGRCLSQRPFRGQRSRPDASPPRLPLPPPVRHPAPPPGPVRPGPRRFFARHPLRPLRPAPPDAASTSTPLRENYLPPDQSVPRNRFRRARLSIRPIPVPSPWPLYR